MAKEIRFGKNAKDSMLKGIDQLSNAVSITLGPKGRNVVLDKGFKSPLITNDGVSIAKEIEFKDPFMNMGAKLIYEVANNTNELAGDGTTTATLLAKNMIHLGLDEVSHGANPVLMKQGIDMASKKVSETLLNNSHKVETNSDIENVATISSESTEIGKIIAKAMDTVGKNGVINVDKSRGFDTTLEVTKGLKYERGYVSPYLIGDLDSTSITMEDALVLVTNHKINSIQEILPLLEEIVKAHRPLLIIAEEMDQEVINTIVVNKLRGTFNVVATDAPSYGDFQVDQLKDIALITGAKFIGKGYTELKDVKMEDLGSAKKIIVKKDDTTIIGGAGEQAPIDERINELNEKIKETNSKFAREQLEKRLGKLANGIALIKVGATTESELKEKSMRLEDALNATKAAVSEGVVLGGGSALINVYKQIKGNLHSDVNDIQKGINVVLESLKAPLYQIAENAGYSGKDVVEECLSKSDNIGFNAINGEFVDMLKEGIIDPTKVTRSAVLNASSIAGLFLTTEAAVGEEKEEVKSNVQTQY